jgi:hypothetical protein
MFGTIAAAGVRIISREELDRRALMILAVSLAMGLGVAQVPEVLQHLPDLAKSVLLRRRHRRPHRHPAQSAAAQTRRRTGLTHRHPCTKAPPCGALPCSPPRSVLGSLCSGCLSCPIPCFPRPAQPHPIRSWPRSSAGCGMRP